MYLCYVDEAGCTGVLPAPGSSIQPVFLVLGVIVDQTRLRSLTLDMIDLKRRFFPGAVIKDGSGRRPANHHEWIMAEIKGADVRRALWDAGRNKRRHAIGFLDRFVGMLEAHQARLLGRLFVKGIGAAMDGKAMYGSSIQSIFAGFHHFLTRANDNAEGIVIVDSRRKHMNVNVSYSIFTQKFKRSGDDHSRVAELPVFGHSENHAGLQLADLICSSLLSPMATFAFCSGFLTSDTHLKPQFELLRNRYGHRLSQLQHRYVVSQPVFKHRGGVVVSDGLAQRSGSLLFKPNMPELPDRSSPLAFPPTIR